MDMQREIPKFRIVIVAILLITSGMSCKFLSGGSSSTVPKDQNVSPADAQATKSNSQDLPTTESQETTATPVTIPDGWKVSKDSTGACQVATPPEWQLGVDFFIGVNKADPGPFENAPGQYPLTGLALWGVDDSSQLPVGHYFQIRTSRVDDGQVCSVWRLKADADFTDEEKIFMEQVGGTLQAVY
jgi:hypothetical protein